MNMDLFTVLDMVAQRYLKPFWGENAASAIRSFGDVCKDPEHPFSQHPEDYALYHIGTFDGETGMVTPMEPRRLATASSFALQQELKPLPDHQGPYNNELEVDRVAKEGRA